MAYRHRRLRPAGRTVFLKPTPTPTRWPAAPWRNDGTALLGVEGTSANGIRYDVGGTGIRVSMTYFVPTCYARSIVGRPKILVIEDRRLNAVAAWVDGVPVEPSTVSFRSTGFRVA